MPTFWIEHNSLSEHEGKTYIQVLIMFTVVSHLWLWNCNTHDGSYSHCQGYLGFTWNSLSMNRQGPVLVRLWEVNTQAGTDGLETAELIENSGRECHPPIKWLTECLVWEGGELGLTERKLADLGGISESFEHQILPTVSLCDEL